MIKDFTKAKDRIKKSATGASSKNLFGKMISSKHEEMKKVLAKAKK